MKDREEELFAREQEQKMKEKMYRDMKTKGVKYFERGFEFYYLSMAYEIMIEYLQDEKYEECAVIRDVIRCFLFENPGALEIAIRDMKKMQERMYRNQLLRQIKQQKNHE